MGRRTRAPWCTQVGLVAPHNVMIGAVDHVVCAAGSSSVVAEGSKPVLFESVLGLVPQAAAAHAPVQTAGTVLPPAAYAVGPLPSPPSGNPAFSGSSTLLFHRPNSARAPATADTEPSGYSSEGSAPVSENDIPGALHIR